MGSSRAGAVALPRTPDAVATTLTTSQIATTRKAVLLFAGPPLMLIATMAEHRFPKQTRSAVIKY